jgi:inorganic pyrophosphatase
MIGEISDQVKQMQEIDADSFNPGENVAEKVALIQTTSKQFAAEKKICQYTGQPWVALPNHQRCVAISTTASLKKMIAPGCIVILSPLIFGYLFGYKFVSGMLAGVITSGIQIAFSASNTGGAWDNCKKYVEAGKLDRANNGPDARERQKDANGKVLQATPVFVQKKSDHHKAAVCGDTVGDPLKDTSGPSINILIKLMAITSLVFGTFIAEYGGLIQGRGHAAAN